MKVKALVDCFVDNGFRKEGETFESQGYVFEILDMDRYRVDKVFVAPARKESPGATADQPAKPPHP